MTARKTLRKEQAASEADPKYVMTISRLTVDKLGVKLYDKVSAVIAELVSNSYDADGTTVTIKAPMGEYLASRAQEAIRDKGFTIEVNDNGIGMTPSEVNKFYLRVGAERRKDERGDVSKKYGRKVMGNKGVGKLAPFGICEQIEIITSGGKRITQEQGKGKRVSGYMTANIVLHRSHILKDEDFNYEPEVGPLDGTLAKATGTRIILSDFAFRKVPTLEEFSRQLAQRFGIQSQNWQIELIDTVKTEDDPDYSTTVGKFEVKTMENTEIIFRPTSTTIQGKASLLESQQSVLTAQLQLSDLNTELNDLLGLPLDTQLDLDPLVPSGFELRPREEYVHSAWSENPEILAAEEAVRKATAGVAAAKSAYIPDITAFARQS